MAAAQARLAAALRPNWLDRTIGYIAPTWGAERLQARARTAAYEAMVGLSGGYGYNGARYDRRGLRDWFVSANDADSDTLFDLNILRGRSRDLVRNTPLATGAVETVVSHTVGSGLSLKARPDWQRLGMTEDQADNWVETVQGEFNLWAGSYYCDATRTQNFYGLQELMLRSQLESGDSFALLPILPDRHSPYATTIQVIEADRIASPPQSQVPNMALAAGVELDDNGAPTGYWIANRHPGSYIVGADIKFTRYAAYGELTGRRNVIHCFRRTRPDQRRGVPFLAPVIEQFKMLDRYSEAELMAAVVGALFTVFVTSEAGDGLTDTSGGKKGDDLQLGSGTVVDLAPGEKVTPATVTRPNANFHPFVEAISQQIGVAIGVPYEVLVKHFTASYSASRAALMEAFHFYLSRRQFLSGQFCDPAYEAWMEEAVILGRVNAPGFFSADPAIRRAYLQADWIGDAMAQLDPEKEVNAAAKRVEIGIATLADETMALTGQTWKDKNREQIRERQMRVAGGLIPATPGPPSGPLPGQSSPAMPTPANKTWPPTSGSDREQPENENATA